MFLPTTIFDMVWGVRFLQESHDIPYAVAVMRSASVPFGWIIGCPLLGLLSDRIGRRKPVIIGGAIGPARSASSSSSMARPDLFPPYSLGLVAGIASGAAMLPYTVIKEANRPEHSGTATGVINFINFSLSALLGPVFGSLLMRVSGGGERELGHYQAAFAPLVFGVAAAIVLTLFLRETGPARRRQIASAALDYRTGPIRAASTEGAYDMASQAARLHKKPTTEASRGSASRPAYGPRRSTSATSFRSNVTPYDGDGAFLAGPTERTKAIMEKLQPLFAEERKKSVLDVSQIPSSITAHDAGYIDKEREIIVGLQTDAPLKRAIMPNGGFRLVLTALKTYGYQPDPAVVETFTKYRKTHNDAVFDAYTADIRRCRSSHILTGLPDAYGRGRIIGDYRRVALYGVDRLIARKKEEKSALDDAWSTDDIIRDREELSEQTRALGELKEMAAKYGFDISGPARTAKEAVQWLYFGYLAGVKEQNGAAMSLGRTSTFLDIYMQRDLEAGLLTEEQAQEIVDDFVIKLRIVRFLRTPEYDELFSGDPTWVTESIGGMGDDGRPLVTKNSFRFLQTLYNLGPAPEPNLTVWYSPRLPERFRNFAAKVAIDTSSIQFESDELMRSAWGDDGAIACCVSPMRVGKQMQFFGARANLAKCLLYAINGGRDEISGEQIGPANGPVEGDYLDFDDVLGKYEHMMDWLAGVYVSAMNVIHYMHDKYAYERIEMALHDYSPLRTMAFGIAGMSVVADSLSAIMHAQGEGRARQDRTGRRLRHRRRISGLRQQRQPGRPSGDLAGLDVHGEAAQIPHLPQRPAYPVGADHHLQRRLRQGDGQHARWAPAGRALCTGRKPDARPRQPWHPRIRCLGRQDSLSRRRRRNFADDEHRSGGAWPHGGGARAESDGRARRLLRVDRLPHERQRPQSRDADRRHGSSGKISDPHDPRLRLRRQFCPADPRTADGRDQPNVPRGNDMSGPAARQILLWKGARSNSGSISARAFPSPTSTP